MISKILDELDTSLLRQYSTVCITRDGTLMLYPRNAPGALRIPADEEEIENMRKELIDILNDPDWMIERIARFEKWRQRT
jgi:hypothetical protein